MIEPKNIEGERHTGSLSHEVVVISLRYVQRQLAHWARNSGLREFGHNGRPLPQWSELPDPDGDPEQRAELKRRLEMIANHQDQAVYGSGLASHLREFYRANFGAEGLAPKPERTW